MLSNRCMNLGSCLFDKNLRQGVYHRRGMTFGLCVTHMGTKKINRDGHWTIQKQLGVGIKVGLMHSSGKSISQSYNHAQ